MPVFGIASPIRSDQGKIIGALSGVVNLGQPNFLDKITENRYGNTGGYLLIGSPAAAIPDVVRSTATAGGSGDNRG